MQLNCIYLNLLFLWLNGGEIRDVRYSGHYAFFCPIFGFQKKLKKLIIPLKNARKWSLVARAKYLADIPVIYQAPIATIKNDTISKKKVRFLDVFVIIS
jgi:hypothetical protein